MVDAVLLHGLLLQNHDADFSRLNSWMGGPLSTHLTENSSADG